MLEQEGEICWGRGGHKENQLQPKKYTNKLLIFYTPEGLLLSLVCKVVQHITEMLISIVQNDLFSDTHYIVVGMWSHNM